MKGKDDILVKTKPLLEIVNKPWKDFLAFDVHEPEIELKRKISKDAPGIPPEYGISGRAYGLFCLILF
jgi:hypothetical protein